jgi:hypothetical protein
MLGGSKLLSIRQYCCMFLSDDQEMTGKLDCVNCTKCMLAWMCVTPTTFHATEPLQCGHLDLCCAQPTAIRGG